MGTEWAALAGADVTVAARSLLGCRLTTGAGTADAVTVRLTEVEAYAGPADPASHAYRGRTPRNEVMFGPPGHLYVYFSYGMHWCLNVVCGPDGTAAAVLLRAGEVIAGVDTARTRRPTVRRDADLARGPARLAQALGLDRSAYGTYLLGPGTVASLAAPARPVPPTAVARGPRVGVSAAADVAWRFWLVDDPTVSPYRPHTPRERPRRAGSQGPARPGL
ncbi:DNA-3-methyladenine glycosylase [Luedemannella flava]|uniref:Putative 3-methyladenine DNA glycosylase n=1 Tax=Luedemannella flava TaxID=349316 RepID=A0ABN2MEE7_9ACTN